VFTALLPPQELWNAAFVCVNSDLYPKVNDVTKSDCDLSTLKKKSVSDSL